MIKFHHRKIKNCLHYTQIYMMQESTNRSNIIPIPTLKGICYSQSEEIAKKTCQILNSITNQNPQNWNRQTLKQVQQIVRIINRMNYRKHLYPIPFENIEKILGWELGAVCITESYKQMISIFRYRFNPQQFTEIIEWIETNYPELSKLDF